MSLPLHVLIVEDQPADAELMVRALGSAGFAPAWQRVENAMEYRTQLSEGLDVILADYRLPQFSALNALQELKDREIDVPFIVVTGSISEEVAVECMKQGAADYLLKDRLTRLGPAVTRALEQKQLRDEKRRADDAIKASLREKEVLLQEIHHRVKNNLQIISSLLSLQSASIENSQDLAIFAASQNRIKSMALIHQKLYQSENLARIDFTEYIRSLSAHVFESYAAKRNGIGLELSGEKASLGIDAAIPCGLIVNELITNAVVHAFPEGDGQICVDFRRDDEGRFNLMVSDNGIGLPPTFDHQATSSLGWQLIHSLVDQLGGDMEVTGKAGTTVTISFMERRSKERGKTNGQCTDSRCGR